MLVLVVLMVVVVVAVSVVAVVAVVAWPVSGDGGSGNRGVTVAASVTYSVLSGLFWLLAGMVMVMVITLLWSCQLLCLLPDETVSAVKRSFYSSIEIVLLHPLTQPSILDRELFLCMIH